MTDKRLGTSAAPWIDATVRPGESRNHRGLQHPDHAAMVARTTGWIYYAAQINAGATVGTPLRLFRPKASAGAQKGMSAKTREAVYDWDAKSVNKNRMKWLTQRGRYGPGRKAVQFAESAGEIEEVTEHPVLDLLEHGNKYDDGGEVQEIVEFMTEITGNGYANIVLDPVTGWPAALYPMLSQWTKIMPDDDEFVIGYIYGTDGGQEAFFDRDEVIHFKHRMSHFDPYYGISWTRMITLEADIFAAARQNEMSRFDNEVRPLGVFLTENTLTDDQRRTIEGAFRNHRGVGNSGKVLTLGGAGAKYEPLEFTPKDMEYTTGLDNLRDMILMVAGVPKSKATADDVNKANADAGETQHARDAVLPRILRRCNTFNSELLPLFGIEDGEMWLAPDNPVPEDENATQTRNVAYVAAGIRTINQARADEGWEAMEGGDELRVNGIPLDEVGQAPASPFFGLSAETKAVVDEGPSPSEQLAIISGLLKLVSEGMLTPEGAATLIEEQTTYTREQAMAMIPEPAPETPSEPETPGEQPLNNNEEPAPQSPASEGSDTDEAKAHTHGDTTQVDMWMKAALEPEGAVGPDADAGFQGELETFFRRQTNAISKAVRNGAGSDGEFTLKDVPIQKAFGLKADLNDPWSEALADLLRKHTLSVFGDGGEEGQEGIDALLTGEGQADSPAFGVSFDIQNPEVQKFLESYTVKLARSSALINTTTEKRVTALIQSGLDRSLGLREIANSITENNKGINQARATMIARSETSRAFGEGRMAQWASTGQVTQKRWVLSAGACEFCRAIAKANPVVDLDAPFAELGSTVTGVFGGTLALNHSDVRSEPLHPGCKCTTVAVLPKIGETETVRGTEGTP